MAAPNTDTIYNDIDAEILIPANLSAPKSGAASLRRAYKKVVEWAKKSIVDAMPWRKITDGSGSVDETDIIYHTGRVIVGRAQDDGSGATFQTLSIQSGAVSAPNINGIRLNYWVRSQPVSGAPAVRYLKMAQFLNYDSAASADLLSLTVAAGGWGAQNREVLQLTCGNRGRFGYQSIINGSPTGCGIAAYEQADKTVFLYLRMPNDFYISDVSILLSHQVSIFSDWREEPPTGTLVYDSTDRVNYPPALSVDQNTLAVRGYVRTGAGNKAFQLTGFKSGSGQTLNTNGYIELRFDDGNIMKVAVFN